MISHGWPVFSARTILLFTILFTTLLTSGCAKNGATRWASLPVTIYADSSIIATPSAQSDLKDAMKFWEDKVGRTLFDYKGVWKASAQPYTGTPVDPGTITDNVIFFQNPWPAPSNIIGQTVVTSANAEIQHAMIMINPDAHFCSGDCENQYYSNSARKNLAHELGHFLGLNHTQDTNNVMYPVLQPGGSLTDIAIDQTALNELLPP